MLESRRPLQDGAAVFLGALEQATVERCAEELGRLVASGDVITLQGDLGAGKTTFTRALARGLGVDPAVPVTSPTFAVLQEYQGRIVLYHVDLYRLTGEDDVLSTGVEEYLGGPGVTVIEWPDRLETLMPDARLLITMEYAGPEKRTLVLRGYGAQWAERIKRLQLVVEGHEKSDFRSR